MIPIIAILFAHGRVVARGRRRGDPRGAVHARDAGHVRHRRRVLWAARHRPTGDTMKVDTKVLGPRHALLRDRLRARHRRGLPAARAGLAEVDRGGRPDRDLRLVRQGPLRGATRTSTPRTSRRSASTGWTARAHRADPAVPRLRVVNLQVLAALGLIILGARLLRRRGRATSRTQLNVDQRAARPRHRPDRDRAAREVQLDHLGPPGQGHPGDGQHHRRDGLPVDHPDGRRAGLRVELVGRRAEAPTSPSRRPASPSCRSAAIFIPMARRGVLHGKGLLVGGVFYLVYLGLVVGDHHAACFGPSIRHRAAIYSADRSAGARAAC